MSVLGTRITGLRGPLIHDNDNLPDIIIKTMRDAVNAGIKPADKDVLCITESVVARAQGNYATQSQTASAFRQKFSGNHIGVVFPILSRNRFSEILKAIQTGFDKVTVQLSYPADEVGNRLIPDELIRNRPVNPQITSLESPAFKAIFGQTKHTFTGVDYIEYYESLGPGINVVCSNDPTHILTYTNQVLAADIHTRHYTKKDIQKTADGCATVLGLDDIMTAPVDGSGYNTEYGLLGSNKAGEGRLKLFPRDCQTFVEDMQTRLSAEFGVRIEVMIFGDGAFKCPVSGIWELADPVVSPGFTNGLNGTPSEIKLKYHIDNLRMKGLSRTEIDAAIKEMLTAKNETGQLGTTPRRYTDVLGSLADLAAGSGARGEFLVFVQGFFNNYSK